ncbi:MAG: LPS export ABC transporter periplasmic protein LptC [Planctomycetes bacterium]|nr:LPS export ABC transporter periplasmic protein LptC [Planctomycetota bacterium]
MKKSALLVFLLGGAALWFYVGRAPTTVRPTLGGRRPDRPPTAPSSLDPSQRVSHARIEKYYLPRYEAEELIYEARGRTADVYGEERADLEGPEVTYYGRAKKDEKPEKERTSVTLTARTGRLDRREHAAVMQGNVLSKVNDGTTLATEEATARFHEKTVACPGDVVVTRSTLRMSGTELTGRIDLEDFLLHRSVRVLLQGTDTSFLRGVTKTPAPDAAAPEARTDARLEALYVTCDGELHVERLPDPPEGAHVRREKLTFRDRALLTRQELSSVTATLESDVLEVVLAEAPGEKGRMEVESLLATGHARMVDAQGTAQADEVRFELRPDGAQLITFEGRHKWFSFKSGESLSLFGAAGASTASPASAPGAGAGPSSPGLPPPAPLEVTCVRAASFLRTRPAKGSKDLPRTVARFAGHVVSHTESVNLQSDELEVQLLSAPPAPKPGEPAAAPAAGPSGLERLQADGNVLFVEDQVAARSDRLVWVKAEGLATLTGAPGATVIQERNRLEGRTITLAQAKNLLVCEGATRSRFFLRGAEETAPLPAASAKKGRRASEEEWTVKARRQEIRFAEGMKEFTRLTATEDVKIFGPTQEAEGDTFTWNKPDARMVLVGLPWARFLDGDNRVRATRILMFPGEKRFVLQGRKELSLPHAVRDPDRPDAPPQQERVLIASVGDAVLSEGGRRMDFFREVVVVRADSRILCDRLIAFLDEKGQVNRVRALGNLVVRDRGGLGAGDLLDWSLDTQEVVLRRLPAALVVRGGSVFRGEVVTVEKDWSNVVATNRKGRGEIWVKEDPSKKVGPKKPRPPGPPEPESPPEPPAEEQPLRPGRR